MTDIPRRGEPANITGRRHPVKLQVERDPLAEAVAWTARALPARPTAPVLAGMRLQAGSELTLSTFDYEVSAQSTIPVQADEPGTVLVSGRLLAEIVRSLPGMPETTGTIGADTFASAISQVAIAAGRDDTLPALTGIRMEINEDTLTLVATDRYRLAVRELRWTPVAPGLNTAVLVPARVLSDTARALTSGAEVAVALATGEGGMGEGIIGFEGSGRRTTTRLLSGEYPRYQTLLPNEFSSVAELPAAPFADAVKRVALVAERNTPVRLTFASSEVLLEAGAGDEAQASEAIQASYDGDEMQIAFNPQYLLDGIGAVDSDTVRISFTTPTRPAVITGKGEATPDYRYVIMPIRSAG